MAVLRSLSKIYSSAKVIPINNSSKIALMSDCHRGDGSWADDLSRNQNIYYSALEYYYTHGYIHIEIGDGDELWENTDFCVITEAHKDAFRLLSTFHEEKRFFMIYGNHDLIKKNSRFVQRNLYSYFDTLLKTDLPLFKNITIHEGLILRHEETGEDLFLVHGHQVDPLNSTLWKLARFLVRHLWKPLEVFGINDPTSPAKNNSKKNAVETKLTRWVQNEKHMLIAGHTHRPVFPDIGSPLYFNDGSCVHPYCITAIEIIGGSIVLVKWCIMALQNGLLQVKREVLAGPEELQNYFKSAKS